MLLLRRQHHTHRNMHEGKAPCLCIPVFLSIPAVSAQLRNSCLVAAPPCRPDGFLVSDPPLTPSGKNKPESSVVLNILHQILFLPPASSSKAHSKKYSFSQGIPEPLFSSSRVNGLKAKALLKLFSCWFLPFSVLDFEVSWEGSAKESGVV